MAQLNKRDGWIGFDLDGTLAEYHGWKDGEIGKPVLNIVNRWNLHRKQGFECRIFTARVSGEDAEEQRKLIQEWALLNLKEVPVITHEKDFKMICLYDDRAIAVKPNSGQLAGFMRL